MLICSIGSPQDCMLPVVLYILYINDLRSLDSNCIVLKYADDTIITGYISNDNETYYRKLH